MVVFLERGAAAGGVGDNGVEIFVKEDGEVSSGEVARGIANAGVCGEGTATKLSLGNHDFAAVGGEYPDGGFVETGESDIGDASGEEGHAGAARACGGIGPAEAAVEKIVINARKEALAIGEAEKFQNADAARDGLQAGALIEAENPGEIGDEMGIGEQVAKDEIARDAIEPGAFVVALDARAGVLDEFAVLDAGRAGGFAGATVEAFVRKREARTFEILLPIAACLFIFGSIRKQMKNFFVSGMIFLAIGILTWQVDLFERQSRWPILLLILGALLMVSATRYSAIKMAVARLIRRQT
jgi:hypothetical protein